MKKQVTRNAFGSFVVRLVVVIAVLATLAGQIAPVIPVAAAPLPGNADVRPDVGFEGDFDPSDSPRALAQAAKAPAFHAGDKLDCDTISPVIDRLDDTGLTDCVVYANRSYVGGDFTVFYPEQWAGTDGWGTKYFEATFDAFEKTREVYGNYGVMRSIKVVFALNTLGTKLNRIADATPDSLDGVSPCTVVVFAPMDPHSIPQARQIMAHEYFHCFSYWNLTDKFRAPSDARKWWVEGAADYFSNVAYPKVNFEWREIPLFDADSPAKPLTRMAYQANVFFQYLGNTIGNADILSLLRSLPTSGGEAEQQAALRAFPNMAKLFQDFAERYLDHKIVDWGGELLPVQPKVVPVSPAIVATTSAKFAPDPFVLVRYAPVFAPNKAFSVGFSFPEGVTTTAARDLDKVETWQRRLPEAIDCDGARRFVVALTTIVAMPTSTTVEYTFTASETPCDPPAGVSDPCLIGAWAVVDFGDYLMSAYRSANSAAEVSFAGQEGSLVYAFSSTDVTIVADDFKLLLEASIAGMDATVVITLNGTTTTTYSLSAPGQGSATVAPNQIPIHLQVLLDGDEMYSDDASAFMQLIGGPFEYACDGSTLALSTAGMDGAMAPPVALTRQA